MRPRVSMCVPMASIIYGMLGHLKVTTNNSNLAHKETQILHLHAAASISELDGCFHHPGHIPEMPTVKMGGRNEGYRADAARENRAWYATSIQMHKWSERWTEEGGQAEGWSSSGGKELKGRAREKARREGQYIKRTEKQRRGQPRGHYEGNN